MNREDLKEAAVRAEYELREAAREWAKDTSKSSLALYKLFKAAEVFAAAEDAWFTLSYEKLPTLEETLWSSRQPNPRIRNE